ncbi:MAG: OsmC family protein [bacterium]
MKVSLHRANDRVHFVARNAEGAEIHIDGAPAIGGEGAGLRPMETLLAALATCASMDLVEILRKQRAGLEEIEIDADGTRPDTSPAPFTAIHLHFTLIGPVDEAKATRALDLAVNKYCSVGEMLRTSAAITFDYEIRPGR